MKNYLIDHLPSFLIRRLAKPYIAGQNCEAAIQKADFLWKHQGIASTLDLLGEALTTDDVIQKTNSIYTSLLHQIQNRDYISISVKLTAFGLDRGKDYCVSHLRPLLESAAAMKVPVTLDMEESRYVSDTLAIYQDLQPSFPQLGTVVQSRLFRTLDDINSLKVDHPRIRLTLGIYDEPPNISYVDKPTMKDQLLECLHLLLEKGSYIEIATHDTELISKSQTIIDSVNFSHTQVEFQMLLGVPRRDTQQKLRLQGYLVRLYLPFVTDWENATRYLKRRLKNNPHLTTFFLRNLRASNQ